MEERLSSTRSLFAHSSTFASSHQSRVQKKGRKKVLHRSAAKSPIQSSVITGYQCLRSSCESTKTLTNKTRYQEDTSFRCRHDPHADEVTPTQTVLHRFVILYRSRCSGWGVERKGWSSSVCLIFTHLCPSRVSGLKLPSTLGNYLQVEHSSTGNTFGPQ